MDLRGLLTYLPVKRFKSPPPIVAVVRLVGVIGAVGPWRGGLTLAGLDPAIERAFKLRRLQAVALAINSPGGSPTQSDLIARRIRDLAQEKGVPVLAFCEDVAASGGYWLACAADEIYARETSVVGSIGVIAAGFGFPELLQRIGVERRVYTAGDKKAMLDPFQAEKRGDVDRLKVLQKDVHESFMATVRERRGARLKGGEKTLFSGEFWSGKRAVELGLVDGVGEMRQILRARYGDRVVLRRVDAGRPWWRRRIGMAAEDAAGTWPVLRRPDPRDWFAGLIAAVEERALWSRFGF
ncbi:MAG: S49 family peptidase [Kiloniellaceae bacterium]